MFGALSRDPSRVCRAQRASDLRDELTTLWTRLHQVFRRIRWAALVTRSSADTLRTRTSPWTHLGYGVGAEVGDHTANGISAPVTYICAVQAADSVRV
jgi:hypothetical protein